MTALLPMAQALTLQSTEGVSKTVQRALPTTNMQASRLFPQTHCECSSEFQRFPWHDCRYPQCLSCQKQSIKTTGSQLLPLLGDRRWVRAGPPQSQSPEAAAALQLPGYCRRPCAGGGLTQARWFLLPPDVWELQHPQSPQAPRALLLLPSQGQRAC